MLQTSIPDTLPASNLGTTSTIINHALYAVKQGFAVFLLAPGSKEPLKGSRGFNDATKDERTIRHWFEANPQANYGIALSEEDLILDADPRNYPPGKDVALEMMTNFQLPRTRIIKTPSGGFHLYYKKPSDLKLRKKQSLFPGVDFLSEGAYVVGPGSQTDKGVYEFVCDQATEITPENFLGVLERYADRLAEGSEQSLSYKGQFMAECQTHAPATAGQGGDAATYQVACRGRDLALPKDVVFEIMRDHFNPRCLPPWSESDLLAKVEHAYQYAKNAVGVHTAEARFSSDLVDSVAVGTSVSPNQERKYDLPPWLETRWEVFTVPYGYSLSATGLSKQIKGKAEISEHICGPLAVIARTRGANGESAAGLILEFVSRDKQLKTLPIPQKRLHQDACLLAEDLAELGFGIMPGKEKELLIFLYSCATSKEMVASPKTGWAEKEAGQEKLVFVFPRRSTDAEYRFQPERSGSATRSPIKESGTLNDWIENVFSKVSNNHFALYEICKSLSAPLQKFASVETGGEHIFGRTTSGKTTLIQLGASVWGCGADPAKDAAQSYVQKWNSTANALEATLCQFNDLPIYFDELGVFKGSDLDSVIYGITGGIGKAAMDSRRNLRAQRTWRTLITSTGEISAVSKIEEAQYGRKRKAKGGQLLRIIDREIDQNIFNDAQQVDQIKSACSTYFGTLGPAFIYKLIETFTNQLLVETAGRMLSEAEKRLATAIGSVHKFGAVQERALKRFALSEVAGKLLVQFALIPGLSAHMVEAVVDSVVNQWAPSAAQISDDMRAIDSIRDFILANRDIRFKEYGLRASSPQNVDQASFEEMTHGRINREIAGYINYAKQLYYLHPAALAEASGLDSTVAARALNARGLLHTESNATGKLVVRLRLDGKQPWLYAIKAAILNGDETVLDLSSLL